MGVELTIGNAGRVDLGIRGICGSCDGEVHEYRLQAGAIIQLCASCSQEPAFIAAPRMIMVNQSEEIKGLLAPGLRKTIDPLLVLLSGLERDTRAVLARPHSAGGIAVSLWVEIQAIASLDVEPSQERLMNLLSTALAHLVELRLVS